MLNTKLDSHMWLVPMKRYKLSDLAEMSYVQGDELNEIRSFSKDTKISPKSEIFAKLWNFESESSET